MVYGLESDFVEKLGSLDVQALAQESGEHEDRLNLQVPIKPVTWW